jgi:uncharacterized membrane protein
MSDGGVDEAPPAAAPAPSSAQSTGQGPSSGATLFRRLAARLARTRRGLSGWFWAVLGASVLYSIAIGTLAVLKFQTFHATFLDLGLENEVEWLLIHGGIGGYYASGFAQIYPVQFEEPIIFLFLPIYALYQHPIALILAGTIGLGLAAIPLYTLSVRMLGVPWQAAAVAFCYLVFFPVLSANLFDFHFEDFTPLFFFFMAWAWAAGRPRWMYLGVALTAAIDPLTLIMAGAFLVATVLPPPGHPLRWSRLKASVQSLRSDRWKVVAIAALVLILVAYSLGGVLYTAGISKSGLSGGLAGVLLFQINDKLLLFVLLLAPLAFLPLYSLRGLIVALPYAAFVLDSVDRANYVPFGLQYALLGGVALVFATVDALAAADNRPRPVVAKEEGPPDRPSVPRLRSPRSSMLRVLVAMSIVFAVVYFPLSPVNASVAGGYLAGNHDLSGITTPTAETVFLGRVVALVPPSASVLTQNNIPQLSGRTHIQVSPPYRTSIPYNTILMDTKASYFSQPTALIPYINAGLVNGTFGIVAEGQGAILLEQGFSGPLRLYAPSDTNYTGSQLFPYPSIGKVVGKTIAGSGPGPVLWYGPYATLLPGDYSCTFLLETNETTSRNAPLLTLQVTAHFGNRVLQHEAVTATDFSAPFVATEFTLPFQVSNVTPDVEFRGVSPTGVANVTLEMVEVIQTSPPA